ncbi:hypothetical protein [Vibrio hepatarius]|uniref:hypothetical protein n=1 Tax=Vibrio hepatarius TaxID=171383 RepID=UPI001C084E02|nr:hypothetical protein [Vibrio hepatarius]MBU2895806.1 hypothetical protein [Vibrio hepatarius]
MSESIFRGLRCLSYREKQCINKDIPSYFSTLAGKAMLVSFLIVFVSLLFAVGYKLTELNWLKHISLVTIVLSYISYYSQPFISMYENRNTILKAISNPVVIQLENAAVTMPIRRRYKKYLMSRKLGDLKLTLDLLENQKNDFEHRVSLLVGNLEKFGLTPGLLALIASWDKLQNITYDWVLAIAYIVPLLYVFGIFCRLTISKFELYISLLKLTIDEKTTS